MTDLNNVFITGNVVHDIEEKNVAKIGETTKLTITIANNKSVKSNGEWKNKANFFTVVLWGKLADNLIPYLNKGKSVAIVGTLDQDTWEKDGQKKSKDYITASEVKLLGGKANSTTSANSTSSANATSSTKGEGFPEDIPYDNSGISKEDPIF